MALDAPIRDLLRDLLKTEVLPAIREEMRMVLAGRREAAPVSEYLTVPEAAGIAKVDEDTVRKWIRTAALPARQLPDQRHYRIRRTDLDALLSPDGPAASGAPDPADEAARVMSIDQARMKRNGGR